MNITVRKVIENVKSIFWALLIAFVFRSFLFEHYSIPSSSMEPNLLVGDHLFISKYAYGYSRYSMMGLPLFKGRVFFTEPKRGDIIVFRSAAKQDDGMVMIKRLIGLPGDRIQMIRGMLYVNGKAAPKHAVGFYDFADYHRPLELYEEHLPSSVKENLIVQKPRSLYSPDAIDTSEVYLVPAGHYFMMGDNRDFSRDCRFMEPIPAENLIGRAEVISWTSKLLRFQKDPRWLMSLRYDK